MPKGGELRFESSIEGEDVEIRISDSGSGIAPEKRDQIFQLYYTTKTKGSGIGLAMTFRIVQLLNGKIEFVSEPGKGTAFLPSLSSRKFRVMIVRRHFRLCWPPVAWKRWAAHLWAPRTLLSPGADLLLSQVAIVPSTAVDDGFTWIAQTNVVLPTPQPIQADALGTARRK